MKGMVFAKELLESFDGVQMETFDGGYARISFEIQLAEDPDQLKKVQLMVQTQVEEDEEQGMDSKLTSVHIENKTAKFQSKSYLDEFEKKLEIAVKKKFTLKKLIQLIDQEIRD